jgi:hypothetical protein
MNQWRRSSAIKIHLPTGFNLLLVVADNHLDFDGNTSNLWQCREFLKDP